MTSKVLQHCIFFVSVAIASPQIDWIESIRKLFVAKQWEQVVEAAQTLRDPGADIDYYYGVALAQLGRSDEARAVLLAGQRLKPDDARFAIELGGVGFKQKRYAEAAKWLRRGMRLAPDDSYAADFLATIYLLQGNLEAALKFWNPISKPQIHEAHVGPGLRVDPVLLDGAFTFAPGGTLFLSDFFSTQARLRGLGIFPAFTFHLDAREDGTFDAAFVAQERDAFGANKLEALLSTFRGAVYQTISLEYFNLGRSAINITSMLRWDAQKRRLRSSLSGPLGCNPQRRYRVGLDIRDENWDVRRSFPGPDPGLGALNLRRNAMEGEVSSLQSGGWSWTTGGEVSHRDYRDVSAGPGLPSNILLKGYELKQVAHLDREVWRVPDRRFESSLGISSELATIWSTPAHSFERLQSSLSLRWFPGMIGDDYAIHQQIRAGDIFGQVPFDELFMLGMERDNDLWMRSHIGTRDGRKGSAPLARRYVLSNWEIDKNVHQRGLFKVKLSPFLDVGKSMDSFLGRNPGKWLWDTGLQAKVRILGVGFVVICGKDLRSGNNAFYVTTSR